MLGALVLGVLMLGALVLGTQPMARPLSVPNKRLVDLYSFADNKTQ
jgi:hypothetical protein